MFYPLGKNSKNFTGDGVGGGCIHHPLVRPSVKIMWVMSLVGYDRSVASSLTYVVGLAYFHFHIS